MRIKLQDKTGGEDDCIRRIDAINAVMELEGWYPASLWHVPPVTAKAVDPGEIDRIAEGVLSRYRNSITRKAFEDAIAAIKALL